MKYGDIELSINKQKEKGQKNQIVRSVKNDQIKIRIILSNDICHGSIKPLVSITNQLVKTFDYNIKSVKDYMRKDLTMERILTINT